MRGGGALDQHNGSSHCWMTQFPWQSSWDIKGKRNVRCVINTWWGCEWHTKTKRHNTAAACLIKMRVKLQKCMQHPQHTHSHKQHTPLMSEDVTESLFGMLKIWQYGLSAAHLILRRWVQLKHSFTCQRRFVCHDMMPSQKHFPGMSHAAFQAYQCWECVVCPLHQ